jgi:hypothetical protein
MDLTATIQNIHAFLFRDDRVPVEIGGTFFELHEVFDGLERALRSQQALHGVFAPFIAVCMALLY